MTTNTDSNVESIKNNYQTTKEKLSLSIQAIDRIGGLQSSNPERLVKYTSADVQERVNGFESGKQHINTIPRGTKELPIRYLTEKATIEEAEPIIQRNVVFMRQQNYTNTMMGESMGGNAGTWSWPEKGIPEQSCIGVNCYIDKSGEIIFVGNFQDIDQDQLKKGVEEGAERITMVHTATSQDPKIDMAAQVVRVVFDNEKSNHGYLYKNQIVAIESARRFNVLQAKIHKSKEIINPKNIYKP